MAPFDFRFRLRQYFSVDLIYSTSYKHSLHSIGEYWSHEVFEDFYSRFPSAFKIACDKRKVSPPNVWKFLGDEIVLVTEVLRWQDPLDFVLCFREALAQYNTTLVRTGASAGYVPLLQCKGTSWLAGFPVTNRALAVPALTRPAPAEQSEQTIAEEYIGNPRRPGK